MDLAICSSLWRCIGAMLDLRIYGPVWPWFKSGICSVQLLYASCELACKSWSRINDRSIVELGHEAREEELVIIYYIHRLASADTQVALSYSSSSSRATVHVIPGRAWREQIVPRHQTADIRYSTLQVVSIRKIEGGSPKQTIEITWACMLTWNVLE